VRDQVRRFEQATRRVSDLPRQPCSRELLEVYALYKQARHGDASDRGPGPADVRAHAKHAAWAALRGMRADEAMARYVVLVDRLAGTAAYPPADGL
jgi:acyl-CoA-binding protein